MPQMKSTMTTDNGANKSGTLAGLIKAQRLAKIAGEKSPHDAKNCGQNKTGWLVLARHEELGDDTRHKPMMIVQTMPITSFSKCRAGALLSVPFLMCREGTVIGERS